MNCGFCNYDGLVDAISKDYLKYRKEILQLIVGIKAREAGSLLRLLKYFLLISNSQLLSDKSKSLLECIVIRERLNILVCFKKHWL